jgi:perosamine synthetase
LGLSQLAKLDNWLRAREFIAARYGKAFADLPEVQPVVQRPGGRSAWHLYVVRLDLERLRVDRARIFAALRAEGILVNVHYIPVYWHPYYQALGYRKGLCPVAEDQYERMITLPLWPGMCNSDVEDVVTAVMKVIGAYRK